MTYINRFSIVLLSAMPIIMSTTLGCSSTSSNVEESLAQPSQAMFEEEDLRTILTKMYLGVWDNKEQVNEESSLGMQPRHPRSVMTAKYITNQLTDIPEDIEGSFILWKIEEWQPTEGRDDAGRSVSNDSNVGREDAAVSYAIILIQRMEDRSLRPVLFNLPSEHAGARLMNREQETIGFKSLHMLPGTSARYEYDPLMLMFRYKEEYNLGPNISYYREESIDRSTYSLMNSIKEGGRFLVGYTKPLIFGKVPDVSTIAPDTGDIFGIPQTANQSQLHLLTSLMSTAWDNEYQVTWEIAQGKQIHPYSELQGTIINDQVTNLPDGMVGNFIYVQMNDKFEDEHIKKSMILLLALTKGGSIKPILIRAPREFDPANPKHEIDFRELKWAADPTTVYKYDPHSKSFHLKLEHDVSEGETHILLQTVTKDRLELYESELRNGKPTVGYETPLIYTRSGRENSGPPDMPVENTKPDTAELSIQENSADLDLLTKLVLGQWDNRNQVQLERNQDRQVHPFIRMIITNITDRIENVPRQLQGNFVLWTEMAFRPGFVEPSVNNLITLYRSLPSGKTQALLFKLPMEYLNITLTQPNTSFIDFKVLEPTGPTNAVFYLDKTNQVFHMRVQVDLSSTSVHIFEQTIANGSIEHYNSIISTTDEKAEVGYLTPLYLKPEPRLELRAPTNLLKLITQNLMGYWDNEDQIEEEKAENHQKHPHSKLKFSLINDQVTNLPAEDEWAVLLRENSVMYKGKIHLRYQNHIILLRKIADDKIHRLRYDLPGPFSGFGHIGPSVQDIRIDFQQLSPVVASGIYEYDEKMDVFRLIESDEFHMVEEKLSENVYYLFETSLHDGVTEVDFSSPVRYSKRTFKGLSSM